MADHLKRFGYAWLGFLAATDGDPLSDLYSNPGLLLVSLKEFVLAMSL